MFAFMVLVVVCLRWFEFVFLFSCSFAFGLIVLQSHVFVCILLLCLR